MSTKEKYSTKRKRIHWMDNLRTIIIFLVVLYHVGGVYEAAGLWGWFWIVDDPDTITWVGIVGIIFDIFIMPTMFFISGYLTPPSLKNKTAWSFLKRKFRRLMVPWLIAVFTLIPLYKVIFLYSQNLPQEHWSTYSHITNPNSQNWLWFLPLLFAFNVLYLLLQKANIRLPNISLKSAVLATFVIGFVYSFATGGLLGFRSWTLTPLLDFENERLLLYFMTFLLGVLCYRQDIFAEQPKSKTLYTVASSVAWLTVTGHIFARLWPFFSPNPAEFQITPLYRLIRHLSFYLALLCMQYIIVESFWRYFGKTGRIWGELNRNSYGVYIIHVILIGVFGTLLLNTGLPALAKYPLLIVSTYVSSNLVVSAYRFLVQSVKPRRKEPVVRTVDIG
ncbi:MAG: acyltransferase [Ardenticatenaceae bacterium]|nr:acyltransferase [Ardenticatenaceae bacterium]MCB9445961.1 acyltransferase [Ardenticatenaceae bacterium]